jgi:hypothetical protein
MTLLFTASIHQCVRLQGRDESRKHDLIYDWPSACRLFSWQERLVVREKTPFEHSWQAFWYVDPSRDVKKHGKSQGKSRIMCNMASSSRLYRFQSRQLTLWLAAPTLISNLHPSKALLCISLKTTVIPAASFIRLILRISRPSTCSKSSLRLPRNRSSSPHGMVLRHCHDMAPVRAFHEPQRPEVDDESRPLRHVRHHMVQLCYLPYTSKLGHYKRCWTLMALAFLSDTLCGIHTDRCRRVLGY